MGFLNGLIGRPVYIEGIRVNFRGYLVEVICDHDGYPAALLGRWYRVSYFDKNGPQETYTYEHSHQGIIPWETILHIAEDGFAGLNWPKIQP